MTITLFGIIAIIALSFITSSLMLCIWIVMGEVCRVIDKKFRR